MQRTGVQATLERQKVDGVCKERRKQLAPKWCYNELNIRA